LVGEPIELGDYLTAVNCQRRVLQTLGLERRARDVSPTLREYLEEHTAPVIDGDIACSDVVPESVPAAVPGLEEAAS